MKLRPILLLLALAASSLALGEPLDSPERIARLAYVEGRVAFHAAQAPAPSALPDRPLVPGDRLLTEVGGRAELTLGTATVRLDERTELSIVDLGVTTVRVALAGGVANVHLHELLEDETFEVVTPNTAITFDAPGEYRVESTADGTTELTVRGGVASVATPEGAVRVAAGQRVRLEGRDAHATLASPQPADAFDEWILERELQLADTQPSRYGLREGDGYDELDRYGEWYEEPSYGRVWMPSYAYGGYDPFRYGHWQRVGLGWAWADPMPWGFYTLHYGRWAYLDHLNRWCWVPARRVHHRERVARDTAPFGRPTRRAADEPRPVATIQESPRRIDADRVPVYRRDVESIKPSRRSSPAPRVDRDPSPPPASAPAPQASTPTMRPSRAAESRREAASRPETTTRRAFGVPQPP